MSLLLFVWLLQHHLPQPALSIKIQVGARDRGESLSSLFSFLLNSTPNNLKQFQRGRKGKSKVGRLIFFCNLGEAWGGARSRNQCVRQGKGKWWTVPGGHRSREEEGAGESEYVERYLCWVPCVGRYLGNPMDREAWRATVYRVTKESDTT